MFDFDKMANDILETQRKEMVDKCSTLKFLQENGLIDFVGSVRAEVGFPKSAVDCHIDKNDVETLRTIHRLFGNLVRERIEPRFHRDAPSGQENSVIVTLTPSEGDFAGKVHFIMDSELKEGDKCTIVQQNDFRQYRTVVCGK